MALTRAPKSAEDKRADALIDKAIAVHPSRPAGHKEYAHLVTVSIRLPVDLLEGIDNEIAAMEEPRPSRHNWLLQAVYAKYRAALAAKEETKSTRKKSK